MTFTLRTKEGEDKYQWARTVNDLKPLPEERLVHEFKFWQVVENRFPYSMIFEIHHMLIPKRVVANRYELTTDEKTELALIKDYYVEPMYDAILENMASHRSVGDHYHIHLGVYIEGENKDGQKENAESSSPEAEGES